MEIYVFPDRKIALKALKRAKFIAREPQQCDWKWVQPEEPSHEYPRHEGEAVSVGTLEIDGRVFVHQEPGLGIANRKPALNERDRLSAVLKEYASCNRPGYQNR